MKKLVKLALAVAALTGSLAIGGPAQPASAAIVCPDICCNQSCTSVRHCFGFGGRCTCEAACSSSAS
jgi:hypothetical protein